MAQLVLDADGPGGTYDLITSKLAPGYNPIEVPDCGHGIFGEHIDEIFDAELNAHVFRFFMHKDEDDDRCINFDRQRCEIKTYNQSPDSLLGVVDEHVMYKWKFKIDAGFQPSPKFTHIHQLKAVGGPQSSMPVITLTLRHGSPDEFELRYAADSVQITLSEVDLNPFKGEWAAVTEDVVYGENGSYSIQITKVSDGSVLFSYIDDDIRMWRTDADFIRPKWGIYRSLLQASYLRDEEILFANFCIEEMEDACDLSPSILLSNNNIEGVSSFEASISISELAGFDSDGEITMYMNKDPHLALSWDPNMLFSNGLSLSNSNWNFDNSNPNYYIWTSTSVILANGTQTIGFIGEFDSGALDGNTGLTVNLLTESGGDLVDLNNAKSVIINFTH